ncbi:MAG: glycosyltransferase family 2 protein [Candidatus Omnitrophota bacterium]
MPLISVVIPVHNAASRIKEALEKLALLSLDKEIIVVNDASSDGTERVLNDLHLAGLKVIHHGSKRGRDAAVLTGISQAGGEFTIVQDASRGCYDPIYLQALADFAVKNHYSVVYGSRIGSSRAVPLGERLLTAFFNLFFGSHLTDLRTPYKLVRTVLLKGSAAKPGDLCDFELTAKLIRKGYKITEMRLNFPERIKNGNEG